MSSQQLNDDAQVSKFAELARSLECDEDEARWEERLKAVAKHRPVLEKSADE